MLTVKSSDSVQGDVTVTETVQVMVPGAVVVEVQGSVLETVTITQPVLNMCPLLFLFTVKSSDSVKGDETVMKTVQ